MKTKSPPGPGFASLLLTCFAVSACGGGSSGLAGPAGPGPMASMLCTNSECGSRSEVATAGNAEQILFTDKGRLFVSGDQVYEAVATKQGTGIFTTNIKQEPT